MPIRNALIQDLTGKKFGKLTAIRREFRQYKKRQSGWICYCECGRETWVLTHSLTCGLTRSCGICVRQQEGAAFRAAIRNYRHGAQNRGYEFSLTDDQCRELFNQVCFYCGAKPANIATAAWTHEPEIFIYQGIDRKNNVVGYTPENCVPCCFVCNKAKGERNTDSFIEHCKMISKRFD